MSKRPDFAQKLLDDLRRRKEQMQMSQSQANRSSKMLGDTNGNFRQHSRGSRQTASIAGGRNKGLSSAGNRKLSAEVASKEIVPVGKAQSSAHIGDLSMAIAFALENGGRLKKMESPANKMMDFLHQIGRRSIIDSGMMDRGRPPNSRFPALSQLHVKEISKGVQKLNQILKACANGLNFDRYSIEIGKELLRGAIELEESLRMLVNLQEASEYMVSPQRKQKIRLIECEDDEDDGNNENSKAIVKVNQQKQLDWPRFSFNGPSRDSRDNVRETRKTSLLEQRVRALSHTREAPHLISEKQSPTTYPLSHRRSASSGPDSNTLDAFSNPTKHSSSIHSKPEKGRIPNVIAKLMGLEEIPPNIGSKNAVQKDPAPKQGESSKDSQKAGHGNTRKVERMTKDSKNFVPQGAQTTIEKMHQENKTSATRDASLDIVLGERKSCHRDTKSMENMNLMADLKTLTIKVNNPQINTSQLKQITSIQKEKAEKERRQEKQHLKYQGSTRNEETKEFVMKNPLQRMAQQHYKHVEAASVKQQKAESKESRHQNENKNANRFSVLSNQYDRSQQTKRTQSQDAKGEEPTVKNKLQVKSNGRETVLQISSKPTHDAMNSQKKLPHVNHSTTEKRNSMGVFDRLSSEGSPKYSQRENLIREGKSPSHKLTMKMPPKESTEDERASPKYAEIASIPPAVIEKPISSPRAQNEDNMQEVNKKKTAPKREYRNYEMETRRIGSQRNMGSPLKQNILVLQDPKQRRDEENQYKGTEASINRSKKAEAKIKTLNQAPCLQEKTDPTTILGKTVDNKYERQNKPESIAPHVTIQDVASKFSDSMQAPEFMVDKDQELKCSNLVSIQTQDLNEKDRVGILSSSEQENQKMSICGGQGPLGENENNLKQILVQSQLFLNAAEALYELQIPVGILHASAHKCQNENSKLVLDCSYEVMRRKGRRQELTFYPSMKISIGSMKIKCLDDLVKKLHEDLEELKFWGQNGSKECDVAQYLYTILNKDIQNRNPDVNCMWDFGWSYSIFTFIEKDDIIRDLEKHLLNGLIDEITRDLYI
ncbi:PREDICTED: uncharacterized protein LOC104595704 [Nelumbo nucifera]|uniref:DUF3741 domain-containing protein n=2 Tax=Nelumbo nucifera TaxID=4432 RepID=A0A822ZGE3_NELNU|nr:PREDICTED: uncharacterized protein LOC104595704 [Nelumbo nucifera]DAD40708.1 TPA_asm: hypothetical protein HUJ06_015031 [Nelumbo nucifera]